MSHFRMPQDELNAIRLERARIRRDVGAGRMTVAAALAHPACHKARVVDVLSWQRRWALITAERFLAQGEFFCTPFQTAGNLSERQRALIAKALRTGRKVAA